MEGHRWLGLGFPSPPLWSTNNRLSSIDDGFPPQWSLVVVVDDSSPCQGPFSLSWPCLRGAFAPPPLLTCAAASSSTQKQKQKQHVCQRGRRESGRLRRASLPATLLYGRSHVSVSPGVQGELSYPTHASRGGRATRRCERAVQWGGEEEEPARTHCSLLAASLRPREGRAAAGRSLLFFDGQDLTTTTASKTMPAGAGDACGAVTSKGAIPRDIVADRLSLTRSELLRCLLSRRRRLEDSVPLLLGDACMPSALPAVGLLTTATRKIQTSPAISSRRIRPATSPTSIP